VLYMSTSYEVAPFLTTSVGPIMADFLETTDGTATFNSSAAISVLEHRG
jgi:hypothetical protein